MNSRVLVALHHRGVPIYVVCAGSVQYSKVVHDRLDGNVDGVNTEQIYGGSAHQVSHLELVFSV